MASTEPTTTSKPSRIPLPIHRQWISLATEGPIRTQDHATPTNATSQALHTSQDQLGLIRTRNLIKTPGISKTTPAPRSQLSIATFLLSGDPTKVHGTSVTAPAPRSVTSCIRPLACLSPSELDWTSLPTEEPLTPEMTDEVRMELKRYYHYYRKDEFRRETKFCWMREQLVLELESSTPTRQLLPEQLERFCNKPTWLYWAPAAQWRGRCHGLPFGCIYKEWFRYHDDNPNIEFGHFFAIPVRITPTGPTTIAGILQAHRSFCDQASSLLDKISRGEAGKPRLSSWPNPQHYKLLPLCRAIVVILDRLPPDKGLDPDGFIRLDEWSQRHTLLMVRTGDESGLSAPISFESISAQSLPLARSDVTANDEVDVVRVSLATAVKFIADLQQREEAAFPNSRDRSAVDRSLCPSTGTSITDDPGYIAVTADDWADRMIEKAEEKGIDNIVHTWDAVRRVKAVKYGRPFYEHTPYPFDSRSK